MSGVATAEKALDSATQRPRMAVREAVAIGLGGSLAKLALLALLVPMVWFPWRWPPLTLVALFILPLPSILLAGWTLSWRGAARRGAARRASVPAGVEVPLACVLLATCVAAVPVVDWRLGLPKVLGMAFGASALLAIVHSVRSREAVTWGVAAVACLALLVAGTGLVGTEWILGKSPLLDPLYGRLPQLIRNVVPNMPRGGIHPNELAGTLVFLPPVLLAQAGVGPRWGMTGARSLWALFAGMVALGVLVATQSRSGLAGTSVALALLGGAATARTLRSESVPGPLRAAVVGAYVCAVSVGAWVGWRATVGWVQSTREINPLESFESRLELWDRALRMIQDFPITGIGLGQFSPVFRALYAPLILPVNEFVPHAHNVYLEYALELGLPGAAAFGWLVLLFFGQCATAIRSADPLLRCTGLGLAAGMAGFLVYGLTDAIAPGARAGLVLWIVLGAGIAVGNVARPVARCRDSASQEYPRSRIGGSLLPLGDGGTATSHRR